MYIDYFRLSEPPFSLTPDPRYLFMSERHREGLAHLFYGVQQPGGFVQLTGEIGCGKTTLCRCLVSQLPPETNIALILNPRLTAPELLATVCDELRVPYPAETASIKILIDALNQRLLETHAQRRRTVLIIDEAQNLQSDVLEQIRLLTNLETSQEKLLQIILIGQPELLSVLKRKQLRQLAQRITARYHLLPLSSRETNAYIHHRLLVAGRSDPIFTAQATRHVYRLSSGVPRLINIICDRALLGAYALDKRSVNAAIVRRASRETQGIVPRNWRLRLAWMAGIAALVALTVGSAIFFNPSIRSVLRRGAPGVTAHGNGMRSQAGESGRTVSAPAGGALDHVAMASLKLDDPSVRNNRGSGPSHLDPKSAVEASEAKIITRQPGRTAASGMSPTGLRLSDILADPSLSSNIASSFTSLYARWGINAPLNSSDLGCKAAPAQGFECLLQAGNWLKLRRFDIPAVLEMVLPTGRRQRVTLIGLGDETATLVIGSREYTFPLSEIDRVWDGSFILIWKLPFASRQLFLGMQGKDVIWVRQTLDTLEGKASSTPVSDLYDESLRQRIISFQKSQSLIPDGYVGSETLVRLSRALEGSNAPSISRYVP